MKQIIYFILIFALFSCSQNKKQDNQTSSNHSNDSGYSNSYDSYFHSNSNYYNQSEDSYHTDPNYKYEYRTGGSGDYEYNYDISGSDENGNSVYGNVDIQGRSGSGYIEDDYGNQKDIEVEWIDYGVLEGTDEDGNAYELEVDE